MKAWLSFLAWMLLVSVALAQQAPSAESQVIALVRAQIVAPLQKAQAKRKRFSREAPLPMERRVRVPDATALTDARGNEFVRFAIDERFALSDESEWQTDAVVGCAYLADGKVFVTFGDESFPARVLLGGDPKAQRDVCRAVEPRLGATAP